MTSRDASRLVATSAFCIAFYCIMAFQLLTKSIKTKGSKSTLAVRRSVVQEDYEYDDEEAWRGLEEYRSSFFGKLDKKKCRFSIVANMDNRNHYLNFKKGFYVMPQNWRRIHKTMNYTETGKPQYMKNRPKNIFQRNITFVHVGKAGGTSLACSIYLARRRIFKNCPSKYMTEEESAISRQVDCYTHYHYNRHCFDINRSFIVNTRNPVHRIASWYLYEQIENLSVVKGENRIFRCGQLMLDTCYRELDHLASVGLNGPKPSSQDMLRAGINLTKEECAQWAWATVQGSIPADHHNSFNYDWYTNRLLDNMSNEVFVVRVEHLKYDWQRVDRMVGGTGAIPNDMDSPMNEAASKPLVVSNKTISARGIRNLCTALCEEIQIYKRLLARAANLSEDDLRQSMEEVRQVCPDEVDITPRKCFN